MAIHLQLECPIASPDARNNEVPNPSANEDIHSNKSLKNLIQYIKSAYSPSLASPKWKNFKGLKIPVKEKIRLNNVIWRTWFQQCNF